MMKLILLAVMVTAMANYAAGLAVMSVDFGSEFMKIAIVKPGVPMEIALNKESRRKTPVIVSMRNGDRLFSDPAMNVALKYPKYAYKDMLDLLGKKFNNPIVKEYQKKYSYYNMEADPDTGMVMFKTDGDIMYSVEELLAMILENAKLIASDFAEQPITETVITVPPYFNQAERRAMLRAGDMAGLKVLQLLNDNTAVALNYGVFRRKEFNGTAVHLMFFDMGSSKTTVTLASYQVVKAKNPVTSVEETFPQVTIKGVGFDRTLGGKVFQSRLADHLAKEFTKMKKTSSDVYESPRAMQKLYKEAGRLKQVLSANAAHYAQIEGLLDDEDFRVKVTREQFEEICADLFDRVDNVIAEAVKSTDLTMDEISEVILMGGSTRVPKVQEMIQTSVNRQDLGKSINTDEAAALGASYQAAHLSKGYKVKKFGIKDANIFPIQVEFERARTNADGSDESKTVKRTLFGRMNPFPQKKVMTFNKHSKDFGFVVNYGDLSFLDEEFIKGFGKTTLQEVALIGIEDAHNKHTTDGEAKGTKAHFKMDDSGILVLDKVESLFEKLVVDEDKKEESTFSKIGNTISSFFGGSKEEKKDDKEGTVDDSKEEKKDETGKPETTGNSKNETSESETMDSDSKETKDDKTKDDKTKEDDTKDDDTKEGAEVKEENDSVKQKNDANFDEANSGTNKKTDSDPEAPSGDEKKDPEPETEKEPESKETGKDETTSKTEGTEKDDKETKDNDSKSDEKSKDGQTEGQKKDMDIIEMRTKPVPVKEEIKSDVLVVDLADPSEDNIKASKKKMSDLRKKDVEKVKLAKARNELETFIIDTQDKLYQELYEKSSTEQERDEIRSKFSEASDWLYELEEDTERKIYEDKLKELKKLTSELTQRVYELEERPKAMETLNSIVNYTEFFVGGMQNLTGEDKPFTEVEVTSLKKLITSTKEWNTTIHEEQAKTPLTEKPKLLVEDIARKISDLDREVKYLMNKLKTFRPKTKPKEKTNKTEEATKSKSKSSNSTEEEKKSTDDEEGTADSPSTDAEADTTTDAPEEETLELPEADLENKASDDKEESTTQKQNEEL